MCVHVQHILTLLLLNNYASYAFCTPRSLQSMCVRWTEMEHICFRCLYCASVYFTLNSSSRVDDFFFSFFRYFRLTLGFFQHFEWLNSVHLKNSAGFVFVSATNEKSLWIRSLFLCLPFLFISTHDFNAFNILLFHSLRPNEFIYFNTFQHKRTSVAQFISTSTQFRIEEKLDFWIINLFCGWHWFFGIYLEPLFLLFNKLTCRHICIDFKLIWYCHRFLAF